MNLAVAIQEIHLRFNVVIQVMASTPGSHLLGRGIVAGDAEDHSTVGQIVDAPSHLGPKLLQGSCLARCAIENLQEVLIPRDALQKALVQVARHPYMGTAGVGALAHEIKW